MMNGNESKRAASGATLAKPASLTRLADVLNAYGASPARWPEDERAALEALLAASPEARALRTSAQHLDAALDAATLEPPSPDLVDRVLAAAPRRSPLGRRPAARRQSFKVWRGGALAAFAAAAAFALWITRDVTSEQPAATRGTEVAAIDAGEIAELGVFDVPSDALLDPPGYDLAGGVPTLGCEQGDLGCPEFSSGDLADPTSQSLRAQGRRMQA
jgi:hypothetical protein